METVQNMRSSLHDKYNDTSNGHLASATTTSSRDTAHSTGPRSPASTHSKTCTTPSYSRPQSPFQEDPRADMEEDLVGIGARGYQTDYYADGRPCTTLPRRPLQHQPIATHSTLDVDSANGNVDGSSLHDHSSLRVDMDFTMHRSSEILTPHGSSPTSPSEGLTYLGEMFEDTTYTFLEGSDSQSDSVDDSDICLERLAGDLLSEWFGIDINSLERPIRVIHCLEQVKGQMAAVVEEEGHVLAEDGTEYPETDEMLDADAADDQPRHGGNPSQFVPHRRSQAGEASGQSGTNKKRLNNGDLKWSIPSGLKVTRRYPRKKRRTGLNLSCPYRKRNACRFNAQQYERCALRSYTDMTALKKHLFSDHHKPSQPWRFCDRCRQPFEDQNSAISHIQQCPAGPRPARTASIVDPEDGFDDDINERLRSRKDEDKIHDWVFLYKLLFPNTEKAPDPYFEPVIEDHEIAAKMKASMSVLDGDIFDLTEQQPMDTRARNRLQQQIQLLIESRDRKLLERQSRSIAGPQTPITAEDSGETSMFPPEDDFFHIGPEPIQSIDRLDDIFIPVETPVLRTPSSESVFFPLDSRQVSQPCPPQILTPAQLLPAMGELDSQPRTTPQFCHSFPAPMVPQPEQTASYAMGGGTRLNVSLVSNESLWMNNGSFNTTPTFTPIMSNPGTGNSVTWLSTDGNFVEGPDMSWHDGTNYFGNE